MAVKARGVSTRGRRKVRRQMNKIFKNTGGIAAQLGAHPGRVAYKYKNERTGRVEQVSISVRASTH